MSESDLAVDRVRQALHRRGERMTGARTTIVRALASSEDHLSADQVLALTRAVDADVNRSTVYRTLERLCDLGVVQHVHTGRGGTFYHLQGASGAHLHAQCRVCGRVIDLPGDLLDPIAADLACRMGFVLDATHVALSGTCTSCCNTFATGAP